MGGFGSGRRLGGSKYTVEDCHSISAVKLMRDGLLREKQFASFTISWTNGMGEPNGSIGCDIDTTRSPETMRLHYRRTSDNENLDYHVYLTTTPVPWGGLKWWFLCPLIKNGAPCRRRVGKLYQLGRYFGCRHCHDLTYRSCQDSHKFDRVFAHVGSQMGMSGKEVAESLKRWK
jgi:hypothetical protein